MDPQALAQNGFKAASAGSLFLGQLGSFLVWAGAALFLLAIILLAVGRSYQSLGKWAFVGGSVCVLGAFGILASLFLTDQFAFEYVTNHSWRDLAPSYKFAAVWSGQQGSFLLWATTSAIFGLLAIWRTGIYQRWFALVYSLFLGGLCGILAYETPFAPIKELFVGGQHFAPPDGRGLTPSLQNYWVVIHPPTIFTGFGSLTVLFAFAVSALMTRNAKDWLPKVRPWALVSLAILGLGLVMGGLWAYETQGWGGFWAWDPVENVSFVPWLFGIAFVHGLIVQTTRGRWHGTNILMGGLPFLLFVYGTFLTRSGFLSKFSVHSFAEMNRSALVILMGLGLVLTLGFIGLWFARGIKLGKESDKPLLDEGFNRGKAYQGGVILVSGLATAIALGMSVPFFVGLSGGSGKVVEEPLYHSVVVWFFAPIMLLMGAAPFLSWRSMRAGAFWGRIINVIGLTIGVLGVAMFALKMSDWTSHSHDLAPISFPFGIHVPRFSWVMCLFALTTFAAIANIWRLVELFPRSKAGVGGFMAHLGVATAMSGLILSRGLEMKTQVLVAEGNPGSGLGYTVAYKGLSSDPQTDRGNKAEFEVNSDSGKTSSFTARPGFFFVPGDSGEPTAFTWPHIEHSWSHDLYLSLGAPVTTFWEKPVTFAVGDTKDDNGLSVTYTGMKRTGDPGKSGTAFAAHLKITENGRQYEADPKFVVGDPTGAMVLATPNFYAAMVGMDAADKSAMIVLYYRHPIFPIELFYKPMTMLVWLGTGIMTLGGLLSAFYRRNRRRPPSAEEANVESVEIKDNAAVPVS